VHGEGDAGPDGEVWARLVVGVPPDPGVRRARARPGVLVDDAELLVVEQPGIRAQQAPDHLEERRMVDQCVGTGGDTCGEADVVGEGPTVDDRVGGVQDVGGVPDVQGAGHQLLLGSGQFVECVGELGPVERTPERRMAVLPEERVQPIEIIGAEHAGLRPAHRRAGAGEHVSGPAMHRWYAHAVGHTGCPAPGRLQWRPGSPRLPVDYRLPRGTHQGCGRPIAYRYGRGDPTGRTDMTRQERRR